jgi:hypothetical protein
MLWSGGATRRPLPIAVVMPARLRMLGLENLVSVRPRHPKDVLGNIGEDQVCRNRRH